jgi:hypothetical protein
MATSRRSECAHFVGLSHLATRHVVWNAAGRSKQRKDLAGAGSTRTLRADVDWMVQ